MLAVQLHQPHRQIAQCGGGSERPVDERPTAPLTGEFAADHEFGPPLLEDGFDRGVRLAGPHEVGRCASAEQEPDGLHHDRLTRSRLTGENGEPRSELDLDGLDHREIADAKKAEHVSGTSIVSYV